MERKELTDFYVYIYCDGRYLFNNSEFKELYFKPFYVGKGKGTRCKDTIKKVLRNKPIHNKYLDRKINKIWKDLASIHICKLYENLNLKESLEAESFLIKKFGRLGIDKNGILTNRSQGFEHFNVKSYKELLNGKIGTHFNHKTVPINTINKICNMYNQGNGLHNISKEFNLGVGKIRNILTENNVNIRTKSETRIGRLNPMYGVKRESNNYFMGHKHTEESKKKISEKLKLNYRKERVL